MEDTAKTKILFIALYVSSDTSSRINYMLDSSTLIFLTLHKVQIDF